MNKICQDDDATTVYENILGMCISCFSCDLDSEDDHCATCRGTQALVIFVGFGVNVFCELPTFHKKMCPLLHEIQILFKCQIIWISKVDLLLVQQSAFSLYSHSRVGPNTA